MRTIAFALASGLVLSLLPTASSAQVPSRPAATTRGYGGGFIEFLMSGSPPAMPAGGEARVDGRRLAALPAATESPFVERGLDPRYRRQVVGYAGGQPPGTIVVDTGAKFLYHVRPGGTAVRYGIGVGRPGFTWAGIKSVTMKREWPDWTPPPPMLARRPDLPRHMAGGIENPLGARALYLGSSLYRIHGTNEPHTIGQDVSSGCFRMMNEDVIDLYDGVSIGTRVIVM